MSYFVGLLYWEAFLIIMSSARNRMLGRLRVSCLLAFELLFLPMFNYLHTIIKSIASLGVLSLTSRSIHYASVSALVRPVCVGYTQEWLLVVVVARGLVERFSLFSLSCPKIFFGYWIVEGGARSPSCRRSISIGDKLYWLALLFPFLRSLGVSASCSCRSAAQLFRWPVGVLSPAEELDDETRAHSAVLHQHVSDTRCLLSSVMFYSYLFYVLICIYGLECRFPII
ncbi:hypothetical protein RND81_03G097200 [Saponaria officinalis]|uniref:Uncharacterized protein n=1 Tax=Saponaria officinalis TaxID=3572 RepID=A0AAW1M6L9_SAPOF